MLKKATIFKSIALTVSIVSIAIYTSLSLISSKENLLYKNIMTKNSNTQLEINNKENFEDYFEKHLSISVSSTDNELTELRTKALKSHLYNIRDYLSKLEITYKQIDREEMKKIAKEKNIDEFSGLYSRNSKEILIVGGDTDTSVHETGHAIYYQLLEDVDKLIINALYMKEAKNLSDEYGRQSKEEFFAVAFTEFIYSADTLKENCPLTYKFFEKLDNHIKENI